MVITANSYTVLSALVDVSVDVESEVAELAGEINTASERLNGLMVSGAKINRARFTTPTCINSVEVIFLPL